MKLLADKMITARPRGDVAALALTTLKMPAINHSPSPEPVALCDRFVFDAAAIQALAGSGFDFGHAMPNRLIPPPAKLAWIEAYGGQGWLISGETAYAFLDHDYLGIHHAATVDLRAAADGKYHTVLSDVVLAAFDPHSDAGLRARSGAHRCAALVLPLLLALASPRAATSRRVLPGAGLDRGQKAFALRRAQRGLPVFSYNKVDLIRPQTALYRGEMRTAESLAGLRLHQVIGHWRLIDGVIAPYWIWIEGHQRGDADLGTIVKERQVHLDLGGMRRGFRMPAHIGRRGERVEAVR
ncbi:hypothetical protein AncyloWKF20_05235 [Ancylobacter sp. WKF20]|uniref:hypothetical protein n=1 Tax=Ancylobacter sp. WKF20 TaxID=3039801 RepID=UPI00243415E4|nr:hypothetical protein [Ancylobacter sp. WKF20]WGD31228.1 hypothetical protein AncyloWKF20_05235 [Ancylobacter sp. WKF20]